MKPPLFKFLVSDEKILIKKYNMLVSQLDTRVLKYAQKQKYFMIILKATRTGVLTNHNANLKVEKFRKPQIVPPSFNPPCHCIIL